MEQLNKKIKDIYKQEQTSLPPELSWEEMKDGIFEKMKEQEDEPALVYPYFIGQRKWWFTIATLLVVFTATFIYSTLHDALLKDIDANKNNLKEKIVKQNTNQLASEQKVATLKPIYENDTTTKTNNLVSNDNATTNKPIEKEGVISNPVNKKLIGNNKPSNFEVKSNSNTKPIISISNKNKPKTVNTTGFIKDDNNIYLESTKTTTKKPATSYHETITNISKTDKAITNRNNVNSFKVVKFLEKKFSSLTALNDDLVLKEVSNNVSIKKPAEQKESYNLLQVDAGFTYLYTLYKKSDKPQFDAEIGFPSNYINVGYSKIFANGIYVSTGLNYNKYKTKFELNDTITHTYLVENAHTRSTKNIVTGKTIDLYEDVEVQALSSRRVRHYNQFNTLSIPLIIGKQFNHNKLLYNIGLGSDISLFNQSQGKTLRADKVIKYSKSATEPYHNKVQFSTLLELGIGLALGNHIEIITNFRHKNNISNWGNDELIVKPQALSLGAGFRLKF